MPAAMVTDRKRVAEAATSVRVRAGLPAGAMAVCFTCRNDSGEVCAISRGRMSDGILTSQQLRGAAKIVIATS